MSELLARMEASGLAAWVRESPSIWAYPTILTLHSVGLGIVVGASVVIDLRLLGRAAALRRVDVSALYPTAWWAFAVNAVTGLLLFAADATRKSTQPIFAVKLACIAVAVAVLFWTRKSAGANPPSGSGTTALAWLSILAWLGAIAAGRLMAYL